MDRGAWWAAVHGVTKRRTRLSDFPFTFHFHALEKEMATHSSVPAWRIPGTGEPGGLPPMGSHRVGHNWSNLAAAAASICQSQSPSVCAWVCVCVCVCVCVHTHSMPCSMWDLSSATKDWIRALCSGSVESEPLDRQGSSQSPSLPLPHFPLGNRKSVCYICDSISVLQICSFVPFFRFHV